MKRKLVTIRKIKTIEEISGADRIELAIVDGWKVVVAKDVGHSVGDLVVYCEIDSFLPIKPEFEFLRKSSYKKMGDKEGFRLKTIKMRGQISQGLILPLSVLEGVIDCGVGVPFEKCAEGLMGVDMAPLLGIEKYEPPVPPQLAGQVRPGGFPSFIRKTDEERIQNMVEMFEYGLIGVNFYVSEKLEGTSNTFYFNNGDFGVCSRNLNLKETEGNTRWELARKLYLEENMTNLGLNMAIQGELVGEGIQGNIYKLKGQHFYVFNIYDIDEQEYMPKEVVEAICMVLGLDMVPVISESITLPETIDETLSFADGKSQLNPETLREGLVWVGEVEAFGRTERVSFKTISNQYLAKHG